MKPNPQLPRGVLLPLIELPLPGYTFYNACIFLPQGIGAERYAKLVEQINALLEVYKDPIIGEEPADEDAAQKSQTEEGK